jgi:hypothetical protein
MLNLVFNRFSYQDKWAKPENVPKRKKAKKAVICWKSGSIGKKSTFSLLVFKRLKT